MTDRRLSGGLPGDMLRIASLMWLVVAAGLNGRLAVDSVQSVGLLDFQRFYHAAQAWSAGDAVYRASATTISPVDHWLTLNPPHFLPLVWPLTWWPVSTAALLWTLAGIVALLSSTWIAAKECESRPSHGERGLAVLMLLAFGGTTAVLINGQVALLLTLPATLAWRAARREQWGAAGLWLGVCLALKVFFLFFAAYLVAVRKWRALVTLAVSTAAIWGVGLLAFGPEAYREWIGALGAVTWYDRPLNASLYGVAARVVADASPALLAGWLAAGGLVGLVTLWCVRRAVDVDRDWAAVTLAAVLISPLGWLEYGFLALGPAIVLCFRASDAVVRAWPLVALLTFPIGLVGIADGSWAEATVHSVYGLALTLAWVSLVRPALRIAGEAGPALLLWPARPRRTS